MKIGSYQKCSLVDYPGKMAAVIYTQGCNWRCPYCHNRSLVIPSRFQPAVPEEDVFTHLQERRAELQAVVVTGGEPTVHADLPAFVRRARSLGYAIKLDTNGSRPAMLATLFNEGLLDFVALDVKGPLAHYSRFAGHPVDPGMIELSIQLVRTSGIEYELRTTLVGGLHADDDLKALAPLVTGARRFAVQNYRQPPVGTKNYEAYEPASRELFHTAGELLRDHVEEFIVR